MSERAAGKVALRIDELQVYYGESHAIQGVSLTLPQGVLAVVGRNGMGKSTLCNSITGLKAARSGSIRLYEREISRLEPHVIHRLGVGYVPQGRRVWPSLSVDEHLLLVAGRATESSWTVERVYQTFPRLAERRQHGGSQLSGGEQQMLAIGRALMSRPRLLLLDEPSLGLAPLIVRQIFDALRTLNETEGLTVFLVEQNAYHALKLAHRGYVMVNGVITMSGSGRELLAREEVRAAYLEGGRH